MDVSIFDRECADGTEKHRDGNLRQRMYCIVLRQLSTMQKGVQAAHSVAEYMRLFGHCSETDRWVCCDKTVIVLDGGTGPDMLDIIGEFSARGIRHAVFDEPDLLGLVTSVSVLASEFVWDREMWPDYSGPVMSFDTCPPSTDFAKRNAEILEGYGMTPQEIYLREFLAGLRLAV